MRMIELELHNICSHEHLSLKFGTGLIGIFGPNGSGKSTLINAGPYAALTNDFSRIEGGKEGAIRQQAKDEDLARVRFKAEHLGTQFEIERTLQPSSKHKLTVGKRKPIVKAREIQHELEEVLKIKRRLIDDYIFVEQWRLFDFLSSSTADRAKSFAHLCNTVLAEICWEIIGKQVDLDLPLASQIVDNSDDLLERIGGYKKDIKTQKGELVKLAKLVLSKDARKAHMNTVKNWDELLTIQDKLKAASKAEVNQMAAAKLAVKEWKAIVLVRDAASETVEKTRKTAAKAKHDLETYGTALSRHKQKQQREEELKELEAVTFTHPEKPKHSDLAALKEEEQQVVELHHADQKLIDTFGDDPEAPCSECGQLMKTARSIEEVKLQFKHRGERLKEIRQFIKWLSDYETEKIKLDGRTQAHARAKDRARGLVEEMKDVRKPDKINKERLNEILEQAARDAAALKRDTRLTEEYLAAKEKAIATHKSTKARITEFGEEMATILTSQDCADEAAQLLEKDDQAQVDCKVKSQQVKDLKKIIEDVEEDMESLKYKLAKSQRAREWVALLNRGRVVMHRDSLPRRVHAKALKRMEDSINETLTNFDTPFRVTTNEELEIVAHFRNGTKMAGPGLSGGEKMILSLAFRWTLNSLFASQIGMMVLDEPTAGVDERNLDLLEGVLTNLSGLARANNYQVIMITHEQCLEKVFDQVITIERYV